MNIRFLISLIVLMMFNVCILANIPHAYIKSWLPGAWLDDRRPPLPVQVIIDFHKPVIVTQEFADKFFQFLISSINQSDPLLANNGGVCSEGYCITVRPTVTQEQLQVLIDQMNHHFDPEFKVPQKPTDQKASEKVCPDPSQNYGILQQQIHNEAHLLNASSQVLVGEKLYKNGVPSNDVYYAKLAYDLLCKWYAHFAFQIVYAILQQDIEGARRAMCSVPIQTMKPDYNSVNFDAKKSVSEDVSTAFNMIISSDDASRWRMALIILIGIECLVPSSRELEIIMKAFHDHGYRLSNCRAVNSNGYVMISESNSNVWLVRLAQYASKRVELANTMHK